MTDLITIILVGPLQSYYDNKSNIDIAHNSLYNMIGLNMLRSVEVDRHFIKEKLDGGVICKVVNIVPYQQVRLVFFILATEQVQIHHQRYQIKYCYALVILGFFFTVSTGIFLYFSYIICASFVKIGNKLANILTKGVFHTI